MKILLAVDGSPYTKKMLAYLAAHELFSPNNDYTAVTAQIVLPSQARFVWKTGRPGDLICKTATEGKFDLVVMGSHGHGALLNLVMGSVATEVLAGCKVPVLIVR